jgi:putative transposase
MDEELKRTIALWRFSLLGALVSARREHGELRQMIEAIASRTYKRWDGELVRVKERTIEDWHYRYQSGGLKALEPRDRGDMGRSRAIRAELAELIVAVKRERPRRSIRRIIRMLVRARKALPGELRRSTVHRLLKAQGLSEQPRREANERRSFRKPFAGDLWMGDVMHGPLVRTPEAVERKAYLHLFIDSATRFVTGSGFKLGETAADLESVLKQALLAHGLPRALYVDRGAAQTALSLKTICAELRIELLHCQAGDPEAKGGVERIFRTIRAEYLDELEGETVDLAELNSHFWAWLSVDYHRRPHEGTGQVPLDHWLSQAQELRAAPRGDKLDQVFLHRQWRRVRKDGTVKFQGRLLEVRGELSGLWVELRFDPHAEDPMPQVYVDDRFHCDTVALDRVANSLGLRRRLSPQLPKPHAPSGLNPLDDIRKERERRRRPVSNGQNEQNKEDHDDDE